jgi:hypothetical protein
MKMGCWSGVCLPMKSAPSLPTELSKWINMTPDDRIYSYTIDRNLDGVAIAFPNLGDKSTFAFEPQPGQGFTVGGVGLSAYINIAPWSIK